MKETDEPDLMQAIWHNDIERVQDLIRNGADVSWQDQFGGTPIRLAIGLGLIPIIKLLLANGATVHGVKHLGNTPLMAAIMNRRSDVVDLLLDLGVPVNEKISPSAHSTPLHMAASCGEAKMVSSLLAHGALVDGTRKKWTPLLCAAFGGHAECVRILIEHGADVNPRTQAGNTALGLAVHKKYTKVAEILRLAGAKLRHEI